jgi:hypothetical protein
MFLRRYGTGTGADVDVPMIKRGVVDFAVSADWTPAAGDVKVSKDGGAAANIGTLPTAVAMGNGAYWKFVFSDAELSCKRLIVTVADSATKAVEDQAFIVETYGNASAMYPVDLAASVLPVNVTHFGGTAGTFASGIPDVKTASIATDAVNAAALAANAVTEIQAGLATQTSVDAIQTDTNDIQTRLPAALVGGKMDSIAELDSAVGAQITAIETFATRITTGIVQDGAVWQFTANMLELGPSGGGGGDATAANQEEIKALITGSEVIQVASPNVSGNLVLTQGDDYDGVANPKASWTVSTDYTSGWTVRLTIRDVDDAVVYTTTGAVASATSVQVTIAAPTGLTMTGCPGQWQGKFDVELTHSSGKKKTIALGVCYINEDQTRA